MSGLGTASGTRLSRRSRRRLRTVESLHEKRRLAESLLAEHRLPSSAVKQEITSDLFMQTLLAAADEPAMRRLVEERARLVQSVLEWRGDSLARGPRSREQAAVDRDPARILEPEGAAQFAMSLR